MGLLGRAITVVKAKISTLLDQAENPAETLDYAYAQQQEALQRVRRGVVEVVASKRQLQYQAEQIRKDIAKLENQARQAVQLGREELAREALQRKQLATLQVQGLEEQIAGLEKEQERLTAMAKSVEAKVEAFRTQKEVIKAQYAAAEAEVRISSAVSGVSEEMADVALAMERAKDKTERMKAKASAIGELTESGFLEDLSVSGDHISKELAQLSATQEVEKELATIKQEQLSPLQPPKQLEGGR